MGGLNLPTHKFCVGYRRLNSCTLQDVYRLPRIGESLDQLSGSTWFSTLDHCSGYWQVEKDQADKAKTTFATRRGLYEFNVMPFDLSCVSATYECLMESVLQGLQWYIWYICLFYLDDIIVTGKNFGEML